MSARDWSSDVCSSDLSRASCTSCTVRALNPAGAHGLGAVDHGGRRGVAAVAEVGEHDGGGVGDRDHGVVRVGVGEEGLTGGDSCVGAEGATYGGADCRLCVVGGGV